MMQAGGRGRNVSAPMKKTTPNANRPRSPAHPALADNDNRLSIIGPPDDASVPEDSVRFK